MGTCGGCCLDLLSQLINQAAARWEDYETVNQTDSAVMAPLHSFDLPAYALKELLRVKGILYRGLNNFQHYGPIFLIPIRAQIATASSGRLAAPSSSSARAIRSPAWHRRARAQRSRARGRLRAGKGSTKDWLLVAGHHGTPGFRAVRQRMGKAGKTWAANGWQSSSWYGADWQSHAGWKSQKGTDASSSGPPVLKYDQVQLSEDYKAATNTSEEKPPTAFTVQAVQKAVNAARKATARVARLEEEVARKKQQWTAFKEQMKITLLQQKEQFEKDVLRIEKEITEAQAQSRDAEQRLKAVVAGEVQMAEDVKMEGSDNSIEALGDLLELDPWDLTTDADPRAKDDVAVATYLRRALVEAQGEIEKLRREPMPRAAPPGLPHHGPAPPPATPLRTTSSGGPLTPFFQGGHVSRVRNGGDELTALNATVSPPATKRTKLMDGVTVDPYLNSMGVAAPPFQCSPSTTLLNPSSTSERPGSSTRRSPTPRAVRYAPKLAVKKPPKALHAKEVHIGDKKDEKNDKGTASNPAGVAQNTPIAFNLIDDDLESSPEEDGADGLTLME